MFATRMKGRIIRGGIAAGLLGSSVFEALLATPGRRKRIKRRLHRRESSGLPIEATEAMKIRGERDRLRAEGSAIENDVARFMADQQRANPFDPEKATIFLTITSGQAVRGFLLTDVIDRLVSRFNVVVITQYAYDAAFLRTHQRRGVHILPWFSRFKSRFTNVCQYYLLQTNGSPTHKGWLKNLEGRVKDYRVGDADYSRRKRFIQHMHSRRLSLILGRVLGAKGLIGLYNNYFRSFVAQDMLARMFDFYNPRLVVSTTAHHTAAWPLTEFARERNIATLAYVLSWDNCTTKATLDPFAEHCAVWSAEMAGEVKQYFPYLKCETVISGAPIFDMYHQDRLHRPREEFLESLGLRPELPVIFYATNTPAAMPDEPELIAKFWQALAKTRFGGKASLLVRLHPADKAERYEVLGGLNDVVVTIANEDSVDAEDGLDAWIPDLRGMALLRNSVMHAAVSINVASTMSLESFAARIPTINVAFRADPTVREKFLWSFDMYHTSEHYRAVVENDAVAIARSMDDLVSLTVEALERGNLRGEAMQKTLAQKADYHDGTASARFVEVVERLADQVPCECTDRVLPVSAMTVARKRHAKGKWSKHLLVSSIWYVLHGFALATLGLRVHLARVANTLRSKRPPSDAPSRPVRAKGAADLAFAPAENPVEAADDKGATVRTAPAGAEVARKSLLVSAFDAMLNYADEIVRTRKTGHRIARGIKQFADEQAHIKFDGAKPTVFLIVTCGQAIRNYLLSDFARLLADRYNLVILSPYAYSQDFRAAYQHEGVHVLPWFTRYKPKFERLFYFHLMATSGSGTHKGWLRNLADRAKEDASSRHKKNQLMNRLSSVLGRMLGRRGLLTLYQCYMVAMLPKSMFKYLFERYRPALIISTAVHHSETWPLTYYAQRYGVKTLGKVLSWDNTTTKPALDPACDVCAVWSEEMAGEVDRHFSYLNMKTRVVGSPLFDMYYNRRLASDRATFLTNIGLKPELPYVLYTTNTPSATTDEHIIVRNYWDALCRSPLKGKISLLVRLHPKQTREPYNNLDGLEDVAVTLAGAPVWNQADRWVPAEGDMRLLLNSMLHASVSVNIASTMTLESFALGLPTINVAMRSSEDVLNPTLMWSFDMFHTSDHYKAIVENGAVDIAHDINELVSLTIDAVENGTRRKSAMRQTLEQKAAYCDGTSAQRLFDLVQELIEPGRRLAPEERDHVVKPTVLHWPAMVAPGPTVPGSPAAHSIAAE